MLDTLQKNSCVYLFEQEADTVFKKLKIDPPYHKSACVEEYLGTLLNINAYLLCEKKAVFLLDPMSYNNQCHMFAIKAAQIIQRSGEDLKEKLQEQTEESKFLHLCMMLDFSLMSHQENLQSVVRNALKVLKILTPQPASAFDEFIVDKKESRQNAARVSLNNLFQKMMIEAAFMLPIELPIGIDEELVNLSKQDLTLTASRGAKYGKFYTFPKFAGTVYLAQMIAKEKIPAVLKVKVVTKEGSSCNIVEPLNALKRNEPTLVFEAFATDGSITFNEAFALSRKCPHSFFMSNQVHQVAQTCFLCTSIDIDLKPYRERIIKAIADPITLFHALGVDFLKKNQKEFEYLFQDNPQFPLLSEVYKEAIPKVVELGLQTDNPVFSVCHAHLDAYENAIGESMALEQSPKVFLLERNMDLEGGDAS